MGAYRVVDDNVKHGDRTQERDTAKTSISLAEKRQREEYGGFNIGAALFGWLVANSVSILLIALLSALGTAITLTATDAVNNVTDNAETISLVGSALLLLTLAIAYFTGGYVAGRMSRFDGAKQGLGVWIIGILLTILFALAGGLLGTTYNVFQQLNLPAIPTNADLTNTGLITLFLSLIVSLIAALAGGTLGERYHHKVDEAGREPATNQ